MIWDLLLLELNEDVKHGTISTAGYLGRLVILQGLGRYWGMGFGDLARSTQSFGQLNIA